MLKILLLICHNIPPILGTNLFANSLELWCFKLRCFKGRCCVSKNIELIGGKQIYLRCDASFTKMYSKFQNLARLIAVPSKNDRLTDDYQFESYLIIDLYVKFREEKSLFIPQRIRISYFSCAF